MMHLSSLITSPPDRENLVIEIYQGDKQLAEVSHEPGRSFEMEIYPPIGEVKWTFELEEFLSLLNRAVKLLSV